jgi:WD40 repeat protein
MAGLSGYHMTNVQMMASSSAGPNLMATAEQIRVDCVQLTNNGRYVITGSIYGPPQVWDLKTGELVNTMAGEDLSSTDLHLANCDSLLVGQVAEVAEVKPTDVAASSRLHHRKLQIWDFESGRPMEMRKSESCTASCMMTDGERIVLARTESYGSGITAIIWDVLGNEPVRYLHYETPSNVADHISFCGVSRDNRFVVTPYQNSYDGRANYVVFDLTKSDTAPPRLMSLAANVDVTAILDNDQILTGTHAGELIVWSMNTGKSVRHLSPAHDREVKALAVSKDISVVVSASADTTLKVWNMDNSGQLQWTLSGHRDEVWCCALSNDNELVISGSRDHTIRLWRMSDGVAVAAIDAGVDVFRVLISNNKKTIVALADRLAARKLIMLQIVRSRTVRTISGSR